MKCGDFKDESDAILRSTMNGQDGRSASLTAPNGPAQEELISRALKQAQMTPPESTVWECHGTGTSLGDPIEVGAVRKIQIRMSRMEPLMMGSAKSNIGHLEGGAAMGGLVKCILQCKHAKCNSTLHTRTLNPHLEHAAFEAFFVTENSRFPYTQGHSQVSSFGFGGTNGHGVFWGQDSAHAMSVEQLWMKTLNSRPAPQVRVVGHDPGDWEADFPDMRSHKKGAKYRIRMSEADADQPIKYELMEDALEDKADDDDIFYCITGNFNDWTDDRMIPGEVDGVHAITVDVPDGGLLEFRFLELGEENSILCPDSPDAPEGRFPSSDRRRS